MLSSVKLLSAFSGELSIFLAESLRVFAFLSDYLAYPIHL